MRVEIGEAYCMRIQIGVARKAELQRRWSHMENFNDFQNAL